MRRFVIVLATIAGALAGCAHVEPVSPVRSTALADVRFTDEGYIYVIYYYSEAQMRDRSTEKERLARIGTNIKCTGTPRVRRRDVRWYPATPETGQACASVYYTVQCSPGGEALLDAIRERQLTETPLHPPGKGCKPR